MQDSLGDRIKRYEAVSNPRLLTNCPVIIRVDGKAFHTWTKGLMRPFDSGLIEAMQVAATRTSQEMQGFKLAYVQSDEVTFLITDTDSHEQQGWFGYELNKIVSISASTFTAHFNQAVFHPTARTPALFDSRAFNVPAEDAPNVFVWRQKDWARNSVQMYARSKFSHKQLLGKSLPQVHDMLHAEGFNWATLRPVLKNGTFILPDGSTISEMLDYEAVRKLIAGEPQVVRCPEHADVIEIDGKPRTCISCDGGVF